jgi:hypothetical protein
LSGAILFSIFLNNGSIWILGIDIPKQKGKIIQKKGKCPLFPMLKRKVNGTTEITPPPLPTLPPKRKWVSSQKKNSMTLSDSEVRIISLKLFPPISNRASNCG